MVASQYVKLNTGAQMPTLGFGTWQSQPGLVEKAVEVALKTGYRHIDTAAAYVGEGIKASGVPREEIFLTTKLDNADHRRAAEALQGSLDALETPYLDLWLMHWPCPRKQDRTGPDFEWSWLKTWQIMEELYMANPDKLKAIGVSNVSVEFMEQLLKVATVIPAVDQVELHPSCVQEDIVELCRSKGIAVTAYSPLGSSDSPLLSNPTIRKVAEQYRVSPANVLISLQANRPGVAVLTKSVTPERVIDNFKLIDLDDADIKELNDIEKSHTFRACYPWWTGWGDIGFPDCKASGPPEKIRGPR
ncbi:hypothetical protein NM688_g2372 [Phlebia brevispora]|uniref:Uncharacterized protein n=1 Tax=Phlebia brevispora TaxID=194682 RepID=A0ACC1T8U3_9APHY|nr:hypothetical protein NM688_g2372 [Phlebia brevispora]